MKENGKYYTERDMKAQKAEYENENRREIEMNEWMEIVWYKAEMMIKNL